MRIGFDTSVGAVDLLLDEQSGVVSIYRLGPDGRPVAAALEGMADTNLARLLIFEAEVPPKEAEEIAAAVSERWTGGDEADAGPPRAWTSVLVGVAVVALCLFCAWMIVRAIVF